ncbi:MAG: S8 family serine peptidase [Actinomycetota bacterium]
MTTTTTTGPTAQTLKLPESGRGMLVGIQPDEFLFPSSKVNVQTSAPMDKLMALRAIGTSKADSVVRFSSDARRATWSPAENLQPGRHVLQIGPLLSAEGKEITGEVAIPFQFVETAAKIPPTVTVESMVRLRLTSKGVERLTLFAPVRGKFIEMMKGIDRRTRRPISMAFDETGRRLDANRLFRRAEASRAKRLGKMHEDLHARLQGAAPDELVNVAVWALVDEEIGPDDKRGLEQVDREPKVPRIVGQRAKIILERTRSLAQVTEEMGARDVRMDDHAPVVFARIRNDAVRKLAQRDDVQGLFLYDPKGIDDLQSSIDVANSDDVHSAGAEGSGVRVAVWENGPTSTSKLTIEDRYTSSPSTSDHSQHVHGIIKNKESNKPHGHAPACLLHSANSTDLDALRWAVKDKSCTVINQSFHRSSEPGSGSLSFDDIYKDWLALHWPYPTILQAAGNYWNGDPDGISPPSNEFVNHKGYNSLAVGNHDDSAGAMSSSSVFRNPTTLRSDRELPEMAANGTSVSTVDLTMSGTSMSSPAAAGITALLQSAAPTLKAWPEGCRAILLAGATRNVVGDTWWQDVVDDDDSADGSGGVNARESHLITQNRRSRNSSGTRRGWDVGTPDSGDFDAMGMSNFVYRIQVPSFWFGPRHVKVALAWDSKVTTFSVLGIEIPLTSQLSVDLDLKIFDSSGSQVGYSGSWDNSYEIAEFDANPGETYEVHIRRWSGTDWTWYGIGWTVTGSLFDLFRFQRFGDAELRRFASEMPDQIDLTD